MFFKYFGGKKKVFLTVSTNLHNVKKNRNCTKGHLLGKLMMETDLHQDCVGNRVSSFIQTVLIIKAALNFGFKKWVFV